MVNKKLMKNLVEEGRKWIMTHKNYSYETRLFFPQFENKFSIGILVIVIDVRGFYIDTDLENPIKLYYEKTFPMLELFNQYLTDEQNANYVSCFSKELEKFTSEAYANFVETLANEKEKHGEIYTIDPLHW